MSVILLERFSLCPLPHLLSLPGRGPMWYDKSGTASYCALLTRMWQPLHSPVAPPWAVGGDLSIVIRHGEDVPCALRS